MNNVIDIARYICRKYKETFGHNIDEMKLQKLMYFAQRESLIQTGEPLFNETFRGWKYGPVLKELRTPYTLGWLFKDGEEIDSSRFGTVVNLVFDRYADKDSWNLSTLSHGEYCWQKSRDGINENANSDNEISIDDIRVDAKRISERRKMLNEIGFIK